MNGSFPDNFLNDNLAGFDHVEGRFKSKAGEGIQVTLVVGSEPSSWIVWVKRGLGTNEKVMRVWCHHPAIIRCSLASSTYRDPQTILPQTTLEYSGLEEPIAYVRGIHVRIGRAMNAWPAMTETETETEIIINDP